MRTDTNFYQRAETLHKQNFDLKLSLYNERQRNASLQERLEAAEAQIAEQAEMQAVNEALLTELEKRDQAVEEAVGIICSLEEKVDRLEKERGIVRAFDAQYDPSYFRDHHDDVESTQDPGSSPPRMNDHDDRATNVAKPGPRTVARMPSFLSEQSEGADALRALYLPNAKNEQSFQNLPKLLEDDPRDSEAGAEGMNSPRLSVLSESSFLSVYGDKNMTIESLDLDDRSRAVSPESKRHRKSSSVEKWVDERPQTSVTPARPSNYRKGQFISLNDVLESPLQRLEKLERTLNRQNNKLAAVRRQHEAATQEQSAKQEKEKNRDKIRRTEMTAFDTQETLPPTPDTVSTSTLRLFKTSNDTLSRDAISLERAPPPRANLDRTNTMPPLSRSSIHARPHSAGETINSRRDGHGWDTVAPSEVTEGDVGSDDIEIASNFDPWIAMGREKMTPRIQPPDMFNFSAADASDDDEWGRDMMFNHDSGVQLGRYTHSQPKSDGSDVLTPRPGRSTQRERRTSESWPTPIATSPAFDNLPSPNPPQRRSSLANSPGAKLRKRQAPQPAAAVVTTTAVTYQHNGAPGDSQINAKDKERDGNGNKGKGERRSITSKLFGLGGRSESYSGTPASIITTANANDIGHGSLPRSQSYAEHRGHNKRHSITLASEMDLPGLSATPPPISRYPADRSARRPMQTREREPIHARPSTSSSLDGVNLAREFFGMDGAGDDRGLERDSTVVVPGGSAMGNGGTIGKGSGKKWFGLGRSGSLRR